MTTNPTLKKAIRERAGQTGEPYVVARRFILSNQMEGESRILVGVDESSDKVYWNPEANSNMLVTSKPGRGKTHFLGLLAEQVVAQADRFAYINIFESNNPAPNGVWLKAENLESAHSLLV